MYFCLTKPRGVIVPHPTNLEEESEIKSISVLIPPSLVSDTYSTYTTFSTMDDSFSHDTLSMVSTPWSTESWSESARTPSRPQKKRPPPSLPTWSEGGSQSLKPWSTTSFGGATQTYTRSGTTITLFDVPSIPTPEVSRSATPVITHKKNTLKDIASDTFTSWSLETFTSAGSACGTPKLKPDYPWSPKSFCSSSEMYPSLTLESLTSRKVSRETLESPESKSRKKESLTPMNYYMVGTLDEFADTDWLLIKEKGIFPPLDVKIKKKKMKPIKYNL